MKRKEDENCFYMINAEYADVHKTMLVLQMKAHAGG
jgi:hypothetical protein